MATPAHKTPYLKIHWFIHKWVICGGADGCEIVRDAELSLDRAPPMPASPQTPAQTRNPVPKPDPALKMLNDVEAILDAISRFRTWLNTPDPPKPAQAAPPPQPKKEAIPPFDIQEIPSTMQNLNMPVGAKLMERWFAGELNYSPDDKAEKMGLNQNGVPYPPDMISKADISMKWILGFKRAKSQYETLVKHAIFNSASLAKITEILKRYPRRMPIDANEMFAGKIENIHRHLQF